MMRRSFDLLVVGAGPAGLAAARSGARSGALVAVLDENHAVGGQVWRAELGGGHARQSRRWLQVENEPNISRLRSTTVIGAVDPHTLLTEHEGAMMELRGDRVVLATGARERFLPFPGWTLPGVTGAGGLQALVKGGLDIKSKRVVVAGTGPLLLAAADYLTQRGARVVLIAEQASLISLTAFAAQLSRHPEKLLQAAALTWNLRDVPYRAHSWVLRAAGAGRLQSVMLRVSTATVRIRCDYLACGFDLVPNLEVPALLGCARTTAGVQVDRWQESSVPGVYCAGEITGIGGLDAALVEGQIAGFAATGQRAAAHSLFGSRTAARRFASAMRRAFALREELRSLPEPDTLVCRCEDVSLRRISGHSSWRAAKLQERCGMGACQGRICGPAAEFLYGWSVDSVRPPISPAPIGMLAQYSLREQDMQAALHP